METLARIGLLIAFVFGSAEAGAQMSTMDTMNYQNQQMILNSSTGEPPVGCSVGSLLKYELTESSEKNHWYKSVTVIATPEDRDRLSIWDAHARPRSGKPSYSRLNEGGEVCGLLQQDRPIAFHLVGLHMATLELKRTRLGEVVVVPADALTSGKKVPLSFTSGEKRWTISVELQP